MLGDAFLHQLPHAFGMSTHLKRFERQLMWLLAIIEICYACDAFFLSFPISSLLL